MKRYLITGASRGIGRAIAEELADADHTLLLHGRDRHALAKTCGLVEAKSGKAIPLCYDLRQTDSIEKMIEEIGSAPIDALINNAGLAMVKPVGEITLEEWETTLAVNVTAPFLLTQRLLPNTLLRLPTRYRVRWTWRWKISTCKTLLADYRMGFLSSLKNR